MKKKHKAREREKKRLKPANGEQQTHKGTIHQHGKVFVCINARTTDANMMMMIFMMLPA